MPIGDEEIAFVLVLQLDPILEGAVIIAEVQQPGGPHAGEHPPILNRTAHDGDPKQALMMRPIN